MMRCRERPEEKYRKQYERDSPLEYYKTIPFELCDVDTEALVEVR
jgi:hypothetical protein